MFTIYTNVCKDAVPDSLLGDLTQQLAKATGKPAQVRAGAGRARARRGPAGGAAAERPRGIAAPAPPGRAGRGRRGSSCGSGAPAAAQELLRRQEPVPVPPRGADGRLVPGAAAGPAGARRSRSRGCAAPVPGGSSGGAAQWHGPTGAELGQSGQLPAVQQPQEPEPDRAESLPGSPAGPASRSVIWGWEPWHAGTLWAFVSLRPAPWRGCGGQECLPLWQRSAHITAFPKLRAGPGLPAAPRAVTPVGAAGPEPPLGLGNAQTPALKSCLTPIHAPCLVLVPKADFRQERAVQTACNRVFPSRST